MFRRESGLLSHHHSDRMKRGDGLGSEKMRVGVLSCLFVFCCLLSASAALADEDDTLWNKGVVGSTKMHYPSDFNVFSFNDIDGVWNNAVTFQDIEGPIAAGGL